MSRFRILDSVKPGYMRTPLDSVGKVAPPGGSGTVGSQVMNQAMAEMLNAKSIATQPPSFIDAAVTSGLMYNLSAWDRGAVASQWKSQIGSPWSANNTTQASCHDSSGDGDAPYWALTDGSSQCIVSPTADDMTGKTVAMWVRQPAFGGANRCVFGHTKMEILWSNTAPWINFGSASGFRTNDASSSGAWHHMVFVHGSGFWVDGVNQLASATGAWSAYTNANARIGYDGYFAPGLHVAGMRMWNRALSAGEIAAEFAQGCGAYIDKIGIMTSASNANGAMSASSEYSAAYAAWKAGSRSNGSGWGSAAGTGTEWLQFTFSASKTIKQYQITMGGDYSGQAPGSWTLQGSANGVNWTTLDTGAHAAAWTAGETVTRSIASPGSYLFYRLVATARSGSYVDISEWYLLG